MQEYESTEDQLTECISKLQSALLPPDPTSALGCLMEIKSGVGGSEASIFAADLMRMYSRFASSKKWKSEIVSASSVSASTSTAGGSDAFREVILEIDGEGAFGMLRQEAGVHRVQRVPATESQGRVHTSTAAVVVSNYHLLACQFHAADWSPIYRFFPHCRSMIKVQRSYTTKKI